MSLHHTESSEFHARFLLTENSNLLHFSKRGIALGLCFTLSSGEYSGLCCTVGCIYEAL